MIYPPRHRQGVYTWFTGSSGTGKSTTADVRAARHKSMYAKARRGEIREFTGIDDPYEAPVQPEITLDTLSRKPETNGRRILEYLVRQGFSRKTVAEDGDELDSAPPR